MCSKVRRESQVLAARGFSGNGNEGQPVMCIFRFGRQTKAKMGCEMAKAAVKQGKPHL